MAGVSAARKAAFNILMAMEQGQNHSDNLLRAESVLKLSAADRHLTTALVLGVLRWQIQLDRELRAFLARPDAKLDPAVLISLRLAAFQLRHLDRIPVRAAIDESVELTKQAGHRFASRMVNAVLRKLAQAAKDEPPNVGGKGTLASEGLLSTAAAAHPDWMVDRWTRHFGTGTTCSICLHNQKQPGLAIRLAAPEVETELTDAAIILAPGALLSEARTVIAGDVSATLAFRECRVRIQDEGSQLVAELAAAVAEPERILDACAAPGGKTMILAERHPAAHILACEASAPRLKSLRLRLDSFGTRIECCQADATALSFASEFDVVLADVPCSGTGTLSRNPEIRHRLRSDDLPRQAERQRDILHSALRAVRPGGRVVYSTCSLEPEENEHVIAAVLTQSPIARVIPLATSIETLRKRGILSPESTLKLQGCLTPEGFLRLFPGAFNTDGFFIAMIGKL